MKFFVWLNEQSQGPFDEETIQLMAFDGQITLETLLYPEGGNPDWVPAKGIFPADFFINPTPPILKQEEKSDTSLAEQYDDGCRVKILLTSGLELKIKAIRLYDEVNLAEINSKRTQALQSLQGVSTGLGAIGSIGWVLAASVVIGAVEGVLSAGAAASGSNLLAQVIRMEQKLRLEGIFLNVGKIENIETPVPGMWRFPYKRKARVEVRDVKGRKQIETREIYSALIHSGDEFLLVRTDDDSVCSIRWSAVVSYACL